MQRGSSVQLFSATFNPCVTKKNPTFAWQYTSNIPRVSFFFAFLSTKVEKLSGSNGMPIKLVKLPTCFLIMDGFLEIIFFFFQSTFIRLKECLLQIRCFSKIYFRKKENHTNFYSYILFQ